ncbi:MAG TPA: 4'-phosphopantetheinyl transferase superfamily protein [Flavobacteriales bacterium]
MRERGLTIHCASPEDAIVTAAPPDVLQPNEVQVWCTTLDAARHLLSRYAEHLDDAEQERLHRFRFEHDRERFIIGHGLLRELLGRYLGMAAREVRMERGEFGKPFLSDSSLHFNLSDTKDALLVAFQEGSPIGADIETMHRRTDHEAVGRHFFTPDEVASIPPGEEGKHRFLELWTRKEAVLKACGVGIMDDLRTLDLGGSYNPNTIRHPDFMRMAAPEYHVRSFRWGADHLIAIATEEPVERVLFVDAVGA